MKALVIPSNREKHLREFIAAWELKGGWDATIVVEDGPRQTFDIEADIHCSWASIEKACGADAWIFSRKDSAIRAFGFLMAWRAGAEYVLTLDDDCYPNEAGRADFFGRHLGAMKHPRWVSSIPGMRTRGLPYENTGALDSVANVGLWTGHPDLDAVSTLALAGEGCRPAYMLPYKSWLVPKGQYLPVCGMNLCFKREALPLFYFPPMGEGQPYRRFDDIWAGVIAKRICDHLGWSISVGEPFVEHRRASDPFVNLVKEAPGVAANETFWEAVDAVPLRGNTALECVGEMAGGLRGNKDAYLQKLGLALGVWARLLQRA